VIFAALVDEPAPAPDPPVEPEPREPTLPDEPVATPELDSLDGEVERTASPAIRWGSVTAGVWIAFFLLSRLWRRWPAYLLGAPVFGVCLFIFFGALTELLPSNF
jgi:hypothetical protein